MRRLVLVICCVLAFPMIAQERRPPARRTPAEWRFSVDMYETRMRVLAKSVSRDAFIVGQMSAGTRDLMDFQKLAAIEKVRDRILQSQQRANEDPTASPQTLTALSQLSDTFAHAHDQGTMSDPAALREEVLRQTHYIQYDLFTELDMARDELKNLSELIAKIHAVNTDLEASMVEALGTTFDFMKAGGK